MNSEQAGTQSGNAVYTCVSSTGSCTRQARLAQDSSLAHYTTCGQLEMATKPVSSGGPAFPTPLASGCIHSTFLLRSVRYRGWISHLP